MKNVHFVGFGSKDILTEYYKAADLFVLPTREDTWGLVINEAISFGLPVITTGRCVAGTELVHCGENGYIVPVNDSIALGERIMEVLSNSELCSRVSQRSLEIANKYTIENMAAEHMRLFHQVSELAHPTNRPIVATETLPQSEYRQCSSFVVNWYSRSIVERELLVYYTQFS